MHMSRTDDRRRGDVNRALITSARHESKRIRYMQSPQGKWKLLAGAWENPGEQAAAGRGRPCARPGLAHSLMRAPFAFLMSRNRRLMSPTARVTKDFGKDKAVFRKRFLNASGVSLNDGRKRLS